MGGRTQLMRLSPSNLLGQGSGGSAVVARNQHRAGRRAVFVQKTSAQQREATCLPDTPEYQAALTSARDTGQNASVVNAREVQGWRQEEMALTTKRAQRPPGYTSHLHYKARNVSHLRANGHWLRQGAQTGPEFWRSVSIQQALCGR